MHDMYNLKDMLVKELEEFGKKGELSKTSLDAIDKIAHAAKNVAKVIEYCEQDEYSNSMGRSYRDEGSYRDGRSYRSEGYSRHGEDIKDQLHRLMGMASDDRTRDEIRKIIDRF